ncbi:hypothetical protein Q1695_010543 [Nippostrongylus brasiliensis]|nr:hypothetical protein Q1695_010543 [Nippostrongylus brasiliensis]
MSSATLFESLKSDDVDGVRKLLTTKDSSEWPVEVLLPFVLRKSLQVGANDMELSYVAECLSRFQESIHAILRFRFNSGNLDELSDFIMQRYQLLTRLYGCQRYGAQFKYLVTVCNRRTRLLCFQQRSRKLLEQVVRRLRTSSLRFVDYLISVMIVK